MIDRTWVGNNTSHQVLEPRSAMAYWQNGKLFLHAGTQSTVQTVPNVARWVGIKPEEVVLISEYTGGGFGSRIPGYIAMAIPALLSKKANAPVMMRISREEEHYIGRARQGIHSRIKVGFRKDGRITAGEAYLRYSGGAFPCGTIDMGGQAAFAAYGARTTVIPPIRFTQGRCENVRCDCAGNCNGFDVSSGNAPSCSYPTFAPSSFFFGPVPTPDVDCYTCPVGNFDGDGVLLSCDAPLPLDGTDCARGYDPDNNLCADVIPCTNPGDCASGVCNAGACQTAKCHVANINNPLHLSVCCPTVPVDCWQPATQTCECP